MGLEYKCKECGIPLGFDGLCWKCRAKHHREDVDSWTTEQIEIKKQQVIEKLKTCQKDKFYATKECELFYDLLTRGIDCQDIAKIACEQEIYYPAELFYKADSTVRDILIEKLLLTKTSSEGSLLLSCLAMIGDKKAQDVLYELKLNPKPWRKGLYVDSDIYAEQGGWTFSANNEYIKLNFDKCFSFEQKKIKDKEGTFLIRKRGEKCPHCGCELVDMLVIDGHDKGFSFLGIDGIITASCCPNCITVSDGISCKFTLDGNSEILDYEGNNENYYSDKDIEDMVNNNLVISEQEKPLFYGAFNDDVNTIGGFAYWIQDWEYRECPECGKKMKYLAQIHWDSIIRDGAEGTLFVEICPDCKIITMFHQQT